MPAERVIVSDVSPSCLTPMHPSASEVATIGMDFGMDEVTIGMDFWIDGGSFAPIAFFKPDGLRSAESHGGTGDADVFSH